MKYIEYHDYANVASEMSHQDDDPSNQRALDQMKHSLSVSVTDRIEEVETKAIMLDNNMEKETVKSIVDDLKKIKNAKRFVSDYLDQTTQERLNTCVEQIESILCG
ncbi:unnamed protein product, partial [Didymodactylos carnosus]